ncbi:MAG: IPT/TIG domain-containing protein [Acidobacteriota bacterium]
MKPKESIILIVACLALCSLVRAQTGGVANYFYDANGRLKAVISPTGEAAIYDYDPAGNFTAITRRTANQLSLIEFTPGTGSVGLPVTIYGTGFLATPSANIVKFNGVTASVIAATNTQLSVTVPPGATTGLINITNANGAVTSSTNFFIPSGLIDFSLPIGFGESLPFNFSNPPTGQELTTVGLMPFGGSAGQRISLVIEDLTCNVNSNPPPYVYAQISLISPSGGVVASAPLQNITLPGQQFPTPFGYLEAVALPATGQYAIVIDPNNSLQTNLCGGLLRVFGGTARLYDVPPDITGTINALGQGFPLSVTAPGQNAVLTFGGLSGQRICLAGSQDVSTLIATDVKVFSPGTYPGGTPFITRSLTSSFFVDATLLTANGAYTILVDPLLNKTRPLMLTLYDVPPDVTGSLTIGAQPVAFGIPSVGQVALLTFNVTATQPVTVHVSGNFVGNDNLTAVSLLRADNTVVTSTTSNAIAFDLSPQTLMAGIYKVKLDPQGVNRGTVSVNLTSP